MSDEIMNREVQAARQECLNAVSDTLRTFRLKLQHLSETDATSDFLSAVVSGFQLATTEIQRGDVFERLDLLSSQLAEYASTFPTMQSGIPDQRIASLWRAVDQIRSLLMIARSADSARSEHETVNDGLTVDQAVKKLLRKLANNGGPIGQQAEDLISDVSVLDSERTMVMLDFFNGIAVLVHDNSVFTAFKEELVAVLNKIKATLESDAIYRRMEDTIYAINDQQRREMEILISRILSKLAAN